MDRNGRETIEGVAVPPVPPGRPIGPALRGAARDPQFRASIAVWAACVLAQAFLIDSFGTSLFWADEWEMVAIAVGEVPLSPEWLWHPANEHRAPMTRLLVYALGVLGSWDWQVMHFAGLAGMAAGALALLVAARALRGRSAASDAMLPLLVLSPWHYESCVTYGYAYGCVTVLICLGIGLAATRWPLRSTGNLLLYLALCLAISASMGPAGNLWSMGLTGVVLLGLLGRTTARWKATGLIGTAIVAALAMVMIWAIPEAPGHEAFRSESLGETLVAGAKIGVGWLGAPALLELWPWAALALAIPAPVLLARLARDLAAIARSRGAGAGKRTSWWGLGLFLLSALAVALAMGHGRARYPGPWSPRYMALTQPIAIAFYLLFVAVRASPTLPQLLAVVVAVSVGWSWPATLAVLRGHHDRLAEAERVLRRGTVPLSVVSERYAEAFGQFPGTSRLVLGWLLDLREHDLSVFRGRTQAFHGVPIPRPLAWEAEDATMAGDVRVVSDPRAAGQAIAMANGAGSPGSAAFEVEVEATGTYQLCLRLQAGSEGHRLSVGLDGDHAFETTLPASPGYIAHVVEPPLDLRPGRHTLAIGLPGPGVLLDLIELVPRPTRGGMLAARPGEPPAG